MLEESCCLLDHPTEAVGDSDLVPNPPWQTLLDFRSSIPSIQQDQRCVVVLVPHRAADGLINGFHA